MPDQYAPGLILGAIYPHLKKMTNETYNGWTNYQTWNVALWIQNEFEFYSVALACGDYAEFLSVMTEVDSGIATPDGVNWNDPGINHAEIDRMIEAF